MTLQSEPDCKKREEENGKTASVDDDLLDYDDMLERIGQLGTWHVRSVLLLCIPTVIVGIAFMKYSFALGTPADFRCFVPLCDRENATNPLNPEWVANFIPPKDCECSSKTVL